MTYAQAMAAIPTDAKWSCSFGYPGEGGFTEYYRTPDGRQFVLSNGPWHAVAPFNWALEYLCPALCQAVTA